MKKNLALAVMAALTISVFAQSPQKISYQFVVRNSSGGLVTNSPIGIRIAILQGSVTGTVAYQELFNPNPETNANGLISIEIGTGLPITGTFSAINWATGPYFLKTETDPAGGTNYTVVGTSELLSVPYALHARMAQEPANNSVTSLKILDGSIVTGDLANGTVTSAKIADGNVNTSDLADGSITSSKIADGTITATDLGTGSVTSTKISDGTIATVDIANSAVTTAKISSSGADAGEVLQYTGTAIAWDYAPGSLINYTFLNGPCITLATFGYTYQKLATIGSVSKLSASSKLEVTYYGRIKVASVTSTGG